MKKGLFIIALLAIFGSLGYGLIELRDDNVRLEADIADYRRQLREQTETANERRQEMAQRAGDLQQELTEARNQLVNLSDQLSETREMISPDYERLLQQAREEVAGEQPQAAQATGAARAMSVDPETARAVAAARVPELYGEFMSELGLDADEQERVMSALVEFESMRSQMRADLLAGNLTPQQALDLFGADALSSNLANLLGGDELAEIQQYNNFLNRDAARLIYGETLSRMGAAISGDAQQLAVQTVLDELYSEANNFGALVGPDGSMRTAYNSQLEAYDRARQQLQGELNPEQLNQLDRFIDSRRNGVDLVLEASVDESGGLRLRNERVAAENLPN